MGSKLTDVIEVDYAKLDVVLARLSERKVALDKEVLKYGEAPAGIKEVFELCRGFERAYISLVNESPVASKIKEAFMGEKGLAGTVRKQPYDKVYDLPNVKGIARQADGYQPHLVSPEHGMRQLGSEALDYVSGPVSQTVNHVYTLLLNAAREAAENAGKFTEAALMGQLPMHVPDFKNCVMPAIVVALDEWKRDAEKMAMMLVDMERSYITAGFFRHTMHQRSNKIKQQMMLTKSAEAHTMGAGGKGGGLVAGVKSFFPAFGASAAQPGATPAPSSAPPAGLSSPSLRGSGGNAAGAQQQGGGGNDAASDAGSDEAGQPSPSRGDAATNGTSSPSGGFNAGEMQDPNSFLAGMLDKYSANDNGFLSMASSLRWQKRFFIFSEPQRMMYYFKSAEDVTKGGQPRGTVNVAECVVEDLDAQNNTKGEKSNHMIRIRHKDPNKLALKDHSALILRAENLETKTQWLTRLRRATEPRKASAAASKDGGDSGEGGSSKAGATGVFSSFGGSLMNMMEGDMSWAKDAEPIFDTHLGEGSHAFRADNARDSDGKLLPAPLTLINPMRLTEKARKATGVAAFEARNDAILEQFGSDMNLYTRMVCDTVITTVPKAIVHCMIRKSEKNLLERLFTVIHHLTPPQMEALLREEPEIVGRRKEARAALEDCKTAIFVIQQAQERYNMAAQADRPDRITLPVNCFAYSGSIEYLTPEQKAYFDKLFTTEYVPDAMKAWTVPPPVRSLPVAIMSAAQRAQAAAQHGAPPQAQPAGGPPPQRAGPPGSRGPPPPGSGPSRPPPQGPPGAPLSRPSVQAGAPPRRAPPPPPPGAR